MKKRFLALAVSIVLSLSMLTACGSSPDTSNSSGGSAGGNSAQEAVTEIRVGWLTSPDSLDPHSSNNKFGLSLCYDTLFNYNSETGEIEPNVAETYEWVDDTTLRITLRKGVTFSDGTELKASDVLYSFRRITDPETGSTFARYYSQYDLDNSYTEDDYTFILKYTEPYGPGIASLTAFNDIVSEAFFTNVDAAALWDQTCGTGAYICTENISGSHTTYQLRDNYWDTENTPEVKTIKVISYSEASTMLIDFENGDLDLVLNLDDSSISRLQNGEMPAAHLELLSDYEEYILCLPEYVEAFQDVNVRKAFAIAVDWASLVEVAFGNSGSIATSVLSSGIVPHYKNVGVFEYDPDGARALLASSGYSDGDIVLEVLAGNAPAEQRFYEVLQAYLNDVGIILNYECYDTNTIIGRQVAGETDLFLQGGQGAVSYPEPYLALDKATDDSPLAPCVISDQTWNTLFDKALSTVDIDTRAEIYQEMQVMMKENVWWIPVCEEIGAIAWNSNIIESVEAATANRLDLNSIVLAN